jgi:hypothetical protein
MLFTSRNTPHITLGSEQCLKLLLVVCNTKKKGDLWFTAGTRYELRINLVGKYMLASHSNS